MNLRRLLVFLGLGWAGVAFAAPGAAARPNVVFILLDNLGKEWMGTYGSDEGVTPQFDRLAATGVRFENCYTPSVCSPSRVQLLTGRYPFRTGWDIHHDAALYGGGGFDWTREVTIARVLRDAGYATGIAGKWQVNHLYEQPDALRQHGFQESLVVPLSIDQDKVGPGFEERYQQAIRNNDADYLQEATRNIDSRYWDPVLLRDGRREVQKGRYGPDVFQDFAIDFMTRHRDRPFFFYHSVVLTHGTSAAHALTTTPENRGNPPTDPHEAYADMVRYADRKIGEFFTALDLLGLRDNTIVFVAADNGTEGALAGRRGGRPVQGGLYQLNEAGGNVGMIVNSPKLVPGGRTGSLVDFSDVFPTICELAGVPVPAGLILDGRSFARFLKGQGGLPRTWIYNEYRPQRVVRDVRYKLWSNGNLFDLEADPDETQPLTSGASTAAARARAELQAVLDGMPRPVSPGFEHRSLSAFRQRAEAAGKR